MMQKTWLNSGKPIAHRGLHSLPGIPENSLAAFDAACEAGYPIEIDVRLLVDGKVVVFHDADLARLTGATGPLEEKSADNLPGLLLLGTHEPVPLLSETLLRIAGRVPLLIEIKNTPANVGPLEAATLKTLEGYDGLFAIQSFCKETVAYLAAHAPEIVRGQLSSGSDTWYDAEQSPPHFLAYQHAAIPTPLTSEFQTKGIPLLAWTIQTPEQQSQIEGKVDNYIFEYLRP